MNKLAFYASIYRSKNPSEQLECKHHYRANAYAGGRTCLLDHQPSTSGRAAEIVKLGSRRFISRVHVPSFTSSPIVECKRYYRPNLSKLGPPQTCLLSQ